VEVADKIPVVKLILGLLRIFNVRHVTARSDNVPKALISICNYLLVRLLFRVPLSDYQNVVFYPTRLIQSITYESRSSFSNPEALIKCYWKRCSIVEVPISFLRRQAGEAKGTHPRAVMNSVRDILKLWFQWIVLGRRDVSGRGAVRRLKPQEWEVP
jgi:hypothetical protein